VHKLSEQPLAFDQADIAEIVAVQPEQIESVIVLRAPAPHQLVEHRPPISREVHYFAVQDCLAWNRRSDRAAKLREAFVNGPLPRHQSALTRIDVRERAEPVIFQLNLSPTRALSTIPACPRGSTSWIT
jgi:hypothetical protein